MSDLPKGFSKWQSVTLTGSKLHPPKEHQALVALLDYLIGAAWTDQEIKDALVPVRKMLD